MLHQGREVYAFTEHSSVPKMERTRRTDLLRLSRRAFGQVRCDPIMQSGKVRVRQCHEVMQSDGGRFRR